MTSQPTSALIGSGMLARAFAPLCDEFLGIRIHAAGVSNSGCQDSREYARERERLRSSLTAGADAATFLYFSTCSIDDPDARESMYARQKLEMERLVGEHPRCLTIRLPQVVGVSANPHTLLNYLYAKISRSERFTVWKNATRNVIDIDDVVRIVRTILQDGSEWKTVINVGSTQSYSVLDIIAQMESIVGKPAVTDYIDKGARYYVDTTRIAPIAAKLCIRFDEAYLPAVIRKYYGSNERLNDV